ncbi:COMM domain-containing protein 2 [Lycorma delicatula]|uniref:COMM domain-containing protein 2 n=1 Tax=Lycorma delicatula TaxID=130591 RepID=UPI003F511707
MLFTIRDDHKSHLSILFDKPINVLQDFCRLTSEYLAKGSNPKLYVAAAQKLEVEPQNILDAVEAIVYILLESSKLKLNELDFRDSIVTAGFTDEQQAVLYALYDSKRKQLNEMIVSQTFNILHFKDLEWRFETQVASRSLVNQLIPQITMKLSLTDDKNDENILLQCDPNNLLHMTEVLETALQEVNSQDIRRIQRKLTLKTNLEKNNDE